MKIISGKRKHCASVAAAMGAAAGTNVAAIPGNGGEKQKGNTKSSVV